MIFLEVCNFAKTGMPKGREMEDVYIRDYLLNLLPWPFLLRERIGRVEYVDRLEFLTNELQFLANQGRIQAGGRYFPPNRSLGETGRIEIYRQTEAGNWSRQHFWHHIIHEIGHVTYEVLFHRPRFMQSWVSVWESTYSVFGGLEMVGFRESDMEEFAETYVLYVENSERLKEDRYIRHKFMRDRVFMGREYEQ